MKTAYCKMSKILNYLIFFIKKLTKSKNFFLFIVFLAVIHFSLKYFSFNDTNNSLECFVEFKSKPVILDENDPLSKYMRIHSRILGSNDQVKKVVL